MNYPSVNKTQALGLTLITVAFVAFLLPVSWVAAYWDTEFQEHYEGYDIYYFPNIYQYGIDIGGAPETWKTSSTIQGCRNQIDLWNEGGIIVESYRDHTLYQLPGYTLYFAERGAEKTTNFDGLDKLKAYLDAEFYPTRVSTIHSDHGDYEIFRQGYEAVRYWGELDGYRTPEFSKLGEVRAFINARIEELSPEDDPTEIEDDNPETPVQEDPITGDVVVDDASDTIGAVLLQQRYLISGFLGLTGTGCLVYGIGRREDQ